MHTRRMGISTPIVLFIVALFFIIIGAVLTVSIVFLFIGLPILIIGILLALISIMMFIRELFGKFTSLFSFDMKKSKPEIKPKIGKKRKGKIIDVKERKGVYEAK